jgi:hypothetical protein
LNIGAGGEAFKDPESGCACFAVNEYFFHQSTFLVLQVQINILYNIVPICGN